MTPPRHGVPFSEAVRLWARIGLLSFGGPAGQIALMHRLLVEEKRWIGEVRFLHALNYCMLLPGPEAQQLAVYVGWLLHRIPGGLVAGTLFVLPGFVAVMALSVLYAGFQGIGWVEGLFFGLKPAVLAVVVEALLRISRRALTHWAAMLLAAGSFLALFAFKVPFPLVVLTAGLLGLSTARPVADPGHHDGAVVDAMMAEEVPEHTRPSLLRAIKVTAVFLALWFAPILAAAALFGWNDVYAQVGVFFSKMAVVTFGGAYAVLAYVAQEAVEVHGWLAPGEMLDGLGLAETTPGPLILVLQFVGFLAGYRNASMVDPMIAGILAATLTVWVTFVPCFLWIFLGGPYVEALRGNRRLAGALKAITAAVVGVILNLAVWFALHVLFAEVSEQRFGPLRLEVPDWTTLQPASAVLAVAALLAMLRLHLGMLPTLVGCAVAGMIWQLV